MNFKLLAESISSLHDGLRRAAAGSVNRLLTARNWLIGYYLIEYEQNGKDRAKYGAELLKRLSEKLSALDVAGMSFSNLKSFRQFFLAYRSLYPAIQKEITLVSPSFSQGTTGQSKKGPIKKSQKASGLFPKWLEIVQKKPFDMVDSNEKLPLISPGPLMLLSHFSFSHFVELMRLEDHNKRAFYEVEGIKGVWSVPQLKRQIESLLYERTGMSKDQTGLVDGVHAEKRVMTIDDAIRDPYVLEFAGFPENHQFSENDLENALLDHIQSFLLELGKGFCFEARQKRITLDNEHDRIDLVFYHRILRCHVLIDLKTRKFRHTDAGQMNFYLNYYRDNEMTKGDNPPVGLVLCTHRDETVVKYATAGLDNKLFVSKYLTVLPSEDRLLEFLRDDRERTEFRLEEGRAKYGE